MKNIGIVAVGKYVPERIVTNHDLEKVVETSDEWITTRTGIKERRLARRDETTTDMAIEAAKSTLDGSPVPAEGIELIIVATASTDSNFPAVACKVQSAIGAKNAAAFDVSAACSGFLCAITTAKQYLTSGMFKTALVIAAEKATNLLDWSDRATCVLFGDGAGACILAPVEEGRGILSEYLHSAGEFHELLYVKTEEPAQLEFNTKIQKPAIVMQGQELFKVAVTSMADAVDLVVEKAGLKLEDVDCVVPHQANDRIISAVAKRAGVSKDKFFINIQKYGNTSAAAVAIALYEAVEEGMIKPGSVVVKVTFGSGLVTAANLIKW